MLVEEGEEERTKEDEQNSKISSLVFSNLLKVGGTFGVDIRPFYTSEVIRFRSGFVPSTLKPVPVESISNRFESIHFAMWFRSGSNRIGNY